MLAGGLVPFLGLGALFEVLDFQIRGRPAQLLLDGFELLMQKIFALLFVQIGFDFGLNLVFEFQQLQLFVQVFQNPGGAFMQIVDFQQGLLFAYFDVEVAGNKIDQEGRAFDVAKGQGGFAGNIRG